MTINGSDCDTREKQRCQPAKDGKYYCHTFVDEKFTQMECFNPISINFVHAKVKKIKREFKAKIQSWTDLIKEQIEAYEGLKQAYYPIKANTDDLQSKLDMLTTVNTNMNDNIKDALSFQTVQQQLKRDTEDVQGLIFSAQAMIKEQENSGRVIDCTGLDGQTSKLEGDGVNAYYYSNEVFRGGAEHQVVDDINFVLVNQEPLKGINKHNQSIRYSGFLRVPKQAWQKFTIDSDDGAQMSLNGEELIRDRVSDEPIFDWLRSAVDGMTNAIEEGEWNMWVSAETKPVIHNASLWVELEPEQFYEFELWQVHTTHNSPVELPISYLHLQWESDSLPKQVIPKFQLFTKIVKPNVGISGYDEGTFVLDFVEENIVSFTDSFSWQTADLPKQLEGAMRLRSITNFNKPAIRFTSTQPVVVQIGYDWNDDPAPINDSMFEDTGLFMFLFRLDAAKLREMKRRGYVEAIEQVNLTVISRTFPAGETIIKTTIAADDFTYLQILITPDRNAKEITCGSSLQALSLTKPVPPPDSLVARCEVSSQLKEGFSCSDGLSGALVDDTGGIWRTDNEGVGSQMKIVFKKFVKPLELELVQPTKASEMNKKLRVVYNETVYEDVILAQEPGKQTVLLQKPTATKVLKLQVREVYGTLNNGFGVVVMGSRCEDQEEVAKLSDLEFNRVHDPSIVILSCKGTLLNASGIAKVKGRKTPAFCVEGCTLKVKHKFWGDQVYSDKSSICRAAFQEGVIGASGGEFDIEQLDALTEYPAGIVKDENCSPEEFKGESTGSFKVHKFVDPNVVLVLNVDLNEVVDFKHPQKCWTRGKVTAIDTVGQTSLITINSLDADFKLSHPSQAYNLTMGKCDTRFKDANNPCPVSHTVPAAASSALRKQKMECNSSRYGDCYTSPLDCVFEEQDMAAKEILCNTDMKMVKVDHTSRCLLLNCMFKCVKTEYETKDECEDTCPQVCKRKGKQQDCAQ